MLTLSNLIDGEPRAPRGGRYLDVIDPSVGQPYARCPDSGADDVADAVDAASRALLRWSTFTADARARCLHRLADLIEAQLEAFATAESRDSGKPLALARSLDIPRAIANLRFFAGAATQFAGESHAMEHGAINYTLRLPLGVVGCISPWNLPLYLFTWKVAPALAAGNAVVAKPSEITPHTAWLLGTLVREAGFPDGIFNIVHGTGPAVGEAIVTHDAVKAISFTGSTRTGVAIASAAAPRLKKVSLELGGKNPAIVFDDFVSDVRHATFLRVCC